MTTQSGRCSTTTNCIQVQDVRLPDCESGQCVEVHDLPADGDRAAGVMVHSTETDTKMQSPIGEWRAFLRDVKYTDKYDRYLVDDPVPVAVA